MKRKVMYLCAALILCIHSPLLAAALPSDFDDYTYDYYYYYDEYPRVIDKADLLTDDEESELINRIEDIVWEYDFGVAIVTTDTLEGLPVTTFSEQVFDECGFGVGEDRDGIMFLISMEERDWNIDAHAYGETVFTAYRRERIGELVQPLLSNGDFNGAFNAFLNHVDDYLAQAESGESYSSSNQYSSSIWHRLYMVETRIILLIVFGVPFVIALAVVLIMKRGMKSARPQPLANEYIRQGSFQLTGQRDMFLYRTLSKTKREKSSSSGGSTSSKGSGSHSHTRGKF